MRKSYETPTCQSYEFNVEDVLMQSKVTDKDVFDTGGDETGGGNYDQEGDPGAL